MKIDPDSSTDLSVQIAEAIRDAIMSRTLDVNQRLPSEAELSEHFDVSRSSIREALKRLAAQNLIRTQRGAFGGAFVNKLSYDDAREQLITTSTLLLSMNEVSFDTACEARYALERACAPMAAQRRKPMQLGLMAAEIARQGQPDLTDVDFCASDVAFHRALINATGNPVLSYQLSGAIEAMQPLMNMITFTARSRAQIIELHQAILDALTAGNGAEVARHLDALEAYTKTLAHSVMEARKARHARPENVPS